MSAGLIGFLYTAIIYYMRQSSIVEMKQWDINTVTSGDFTVQIDFSEYMWKNYGKYKKMNKIHMTSEN